MFNYSDECILDLFAFVKKGLSWGDLTKKLNHKYDVIRDHTHYRNLYHRNKDRFEIGDDEKLTIEMIREASQARKSRNSSNKKLKKVLDSWDIRDSLLKDFEEITKKYSSKRNILKRAKKNSLKVGNAPMTMALDISDIHGGLKTKFYDYKKIRLRLKTLVEVFLEEYDRNSRSHNVEDFVISLNGDMIHNDKLHEDSIKTCEEGIPGQLFNISDILFEDVIEPIALIGLRTRVVATAGNHDRTTKGRSMFQQGKEGYSWTIYKTLELLSKRMKYSNVEFIIPEGYGAVIQIQGSNILYEHGDAVKGSNEATLRAHLNARSEQLQTILHGLRIGHFHNFRQFGRKIIINGGLVCGDDFSDTCGYAAEPVQTIVTYCKSKNRVNSLYKVFPVILPR